MAYINVPISQAEFYRQEAVRLREAAAASPTDALQTDFLKVAWQYEILARQAEINAHWPNDGAASLPQRR